MWKWIKFKGFHTQGSTLLGHAHYVHTKMANRWGNRINYHGTLPIGHTTHGDLFTSLVANNMFFSPWDQFLVITCVGGCVWLQVCVLKFALVAMVHWAVPSRPRLLATSVAFSQALAVSLRFVNLPPLSFFLSHPLISISRIPTLILLSTL